VATSVLSASQPVYGQGWTQFPRKKHAPVHTAADYVHSDQNKVPDTPYLSMYSGDVKDLVVIAYKKKEGGVSYVITFETRDMANDVMNWYRGELKSNRWAVLERDKTGMNISARKGENMFADVVAYGPNKPKLYRAKIHLAYAIVGTKLPPP
jgi:hypothetical protein